MGTKGVRLPVSESKKRYVQVFSKESKDLKLMGADIK